MGTVGFGRVARGYGGRRPSSSVVCDNHRVVPLHRLSAAVAVVTLVTLAGPALAGRLVPAFPTEVPSAVRARLSPVVDQASLATRIQGESFVARREVFEYLLEHPEFATHVTQALKVARYRIWRTPTGLMLDDGWGTVGAFVKLDNPVLSAASVLAGSIAAAKAEQEALRLVRVFQKTTRAIDDNPGALLETLRHRPGTPRRELEEFGRLLSVPAAAPEAR